MKRIFLALRAKIDDYDKLKSDFSDVIQGRWIPEENLHLTLCFFGDKYDLDELVEKMPNLSGEIEELDISSLGYFKHNNILYACVNSKKLQILHSLVCDTFLIQHPEKFIAHVTLMRIKNIKYQEEFNKILDDHKDKRLGKTKAEFELLESTIMHPGGAKYKSIKRY